MSKPFVRQPRNLVMKDKKGARSLVRFNPNFSVRWTNRFTRSQARLTTSALTHCEPFIPKDTGYLILSGYLETKPEEGILKWVAKYARFQYYSKKNRIFGLRGPYWFHRMKQLFKAAIVRDAAKGLNE